MFSLFNFINTENVQLFYFLPTRTRTRHPTSFSHLPLPTIPPPDIPNHDAQDPTVDAEEGQPGDEEAGDKGALAEELETVGLVEPEGLFGVLC